MEKKGFGGAVIEMEGRRKWETCQSAVTFLEKGSCPVGASNSQRLPDRGSQGRAVRKLPAGGAKQSVVRQVAAALVPVLFPLLKSPL